LREGLRAADHQPHRVGQEARSALHTHLDGGPAPSGIRTGNGGLDPKNNVVKVFNHCAPL